MFNIDAKYIPFVYHVHMLQMRACANVFTNGRLSAIQPNGCENVNKPKPKTRCLDFYQIPPFCVKDAWDSLSSSMFSVDINRQKVFLRCLRE